MDADPQEVTKFKTWLAKTPPEVIQKHLDNDDFLREWKREMALAEVARRPAVPAGTRPSAPRPRTNRRAALYSWIIAILLVALVLLASWTSLTD